MTGQTRDGVTQYLITSLTYLSTPQKEDHLICVHSPYSARSVNSTARDNSYSLSPLFL